YDLGHVDLPTVNVTGWDTGNANNGVWDVDGHSHGTHCAGSVGALGNNNEGVIGVNPDPTRFSFHIAKGLSDSGSGAGSDVLNAVASCVDEGAKVISMSLGCDGCFSQSTELFYQDVYDQDVLIIAAAGNSGDTRDHFPSGYPSVMSVASVAEGGGEGSSTYGILSGFSTRNDQTEIAGPGSSVRSTVPNDNYAVFSGTSMATPHVAGVAALLWSHFPECTNNQIRNAMIHSVREPPTESRNTLGWDQFYGFGIVNAGAAFERLSSKGCEGAGGAYPDTANGETLSDMALGGSSQKDLGCTLDEHCFDGSNACSEEMLCNLDDHTCFQGEGSVLCDDSNACTIDTCDPTVPGLCVHTPVECDNDDNACNGEFSCDAATGECVEIAPPQDCDDGNACTVDSCDSTLPGLCVHTPLVCDDGNACNGEFSCDAATGSCVEDAPPVDCNDDNACTVDSCDPTLPGLCLHTDVVCDDGNACNGVFSCNAESGCVEDAPPVDCDDGNACTVDTCDPAVPGLCVHTPVVCDDDNACNGVFSCDTGSGECVEDAPEVTCEDGDACTLGTCDALTGDCSFTNLTCDDFNPCTENDTCDPILGCVFQDPLPNCCGNGLCEAGEGENEAEPCPVDCNPDAPVGPPVWTELFPLTDGK
ncbi:hypothetical protein ACHAXR_012487, partial [Thalassiosira sp. AJA248-18]